MKHRHLIKTLSSFRIPVLILSITGMFYGYGFAETPKAVAENPVFTFTGVIAGTDVSHEFIIQNAGTAPLMIPGVYAG